MLDELLQRPTEVVALLGASLPSQGSFFLNYIAIQGLCKNRQDKIFI